MFSPQKWLYSFNSIALGDLCKVNSEIYAVHNVENSKNNLFFSSRFSNYRAIKERRRAI